jgi:hypothetical protein
MLNSVMNKIYVNINALRTSSKRYLTTQAYVIIYSIFSTLEFNLFANNDTASHYG